MISHTYHVAGVWREKDTAARFVVGKTVAFFLSDLQSGGTEWFAIHLARGLRAHDCRPLFLLSRAYGELFPEVAHEFGIVALGGKGYHLFGVLRALPALVRYLREQQPDVLISGLPLINAVAGLAKRLSGARTKLVVVEHMRFDGRASPLCLPRRLLKCAILRLTHLWADETVCVSKTVEADLVGCLGAKNCAHLSTIYNPVIPAEIDQFAREKTTHPWIAQEIKPLVLSIGRLLENKDFPTLLRAFAKVRAIKPQAHLLILGEGEERRRLQDLIAQLGLGSHVSLAGSVRNVFAYLQAADVFVLPSKREAFGNVLVEALACGVPVVSTDSGGPREILEDGRFGRLVPVGDATGMAHAILETLHAPIDRAALMERGRSFSVTKACAAYMKIIESQVSPPDTAQASQKPSAPQEHR